MTLMNHALPKHLSLRTVVVKMIKLELKLQGKTRKVASMLCLIGLISIMMKEEYFVKSVSNMVVEMFLLMLVL